MKPSCLPFAQLRVVFELQVSEVEGGGLEGVAEGLAEEGAALVVVDTDFMLLGSVCCWRLLSQVYVLLFGDIVSVMCCLNGYHNKCTCTVAG